MIKKIILLIVLLAVGGGIFYFSGGFGENKNSSENSVGKIGLGIIGEDKAFIDSYQELVNFLNKYSDHVWYLVVLKDYGSFITQMELGQIQAGFMGSAAAYKLIENKFALPIARGEINGVSTYNGYIFSRKDSGINQIDDLRGRKFAFVDPYTSAGYFFPIYFLKTKGYDPDNFFKVSSFLGSHEKAILSVLNGEYDGGAVKDSVWTKLAKENPKIEEELQIFAKEGPFPDNTFMINSGFGQGEVDELRNLFTNMPNSEEGKSSLRKLGIDRFVIAEESDFKTIKRIVDYLEI